MKKCRERKRERREKHRVRPPTEYIRKRAQLSQCKLISVWLPHCTWAISLELQNILIVYVCAEFLFMLGFTQCDLLCVRVCVCDLSPPPPELYVVYFDRNITLRWRFQWNTDAIEICNRIRAHFCLSSSSFFPVAFHFSLSLFCETCLFRVCHFIMKTITEHALPMHSSLAFPFAIYIDQKIA